MNKYLSIAIGIVVFFVVANLLFLDYFFAVQRNEILDLQTRISQMAGTINNLGSLVSIPTPVASPAGTPLVGVPTSELLTGGSSCPQSCVSLINSSKSTSTVAPVVQQTNVVHGGEYFVPLGSGSLLSTEASSANWKTINGAAATFDAANYGTIKAAYFEAFLHVATVGEVHARLFDTTTPQVFFNSDVSTSNTTSTFVSAPITLSAGTKTFKVQMYSTQSEGYLDQARLRIVSQ